MCLEPRIIADLKALIMETPPSQPDHANLTSTLHILRLIVQSVDQAAIEAREWAAKNKTGEGLAMARKWNEKFQLAYNNRWEKERQHPEDVKVELSTKPKVPARSQIQVRGCCAGSGWRG
jgi:hypothetical protein